jgi:diguanylate cyclase (GGDEF)-like protein/PAS domain S-box-containing protein
MRMRISLTRLLTSKSGLALSVYLAFAASVSAGVAYQFYHSSLEKFRSHPIESLNKQLQRDSQWQLDNVMGVLAIDMPGAGLLREVRTRSYQMGLSLFAALAGLGLAISALHFRQAAEREAAAELRSKNTLLDTALEHISQGLCMFDREQRLVIANNRYAEMYGLTPEQVKPGTTLRQILEYRVGVGAYTGNPSEYVSERLATVTEGMGSTRAYPLADGRVFAIDHKPMADGGWVATHEDITEQQRYEARIAHMALHDGLTDLPNRTLLKERLEQALARVKPGEIVASHLFDLDHFKSVNDALGHAIGDKLLKAVAHRLRALVGETDTVARTGGDEFAIVQAAIKDPADAAMLAARIIEAVAQPFDIDGHHVTIATSIGIAVGPADGKADASQLTRDADLALYRAKGAGRGTFRFFEPGMDVQMQGRRALESDLRKALSAGEFELHYQPLLNLARNDITGVEALIRWRHPERGMTPPGEFIPLAEEIGLILPLGEWAIRQACAAAAAWPEDLRVAVNLSAAQFRSPGLVQVVIGALAASGLAPQRLELEITESILLEDSEATLAMLFQLREMGVRIAMDDFGTGYSSLSYLQTFPFDKIKIDRTFVKDITQATGSRNIVRAVAAMAKGFGMEATAEGVETQEQLEIVKAAGYTEMQGFLLSRPLPADDIAKLLHAADATRRADAQDAA